MVEFVKIEVKGHKIEFGADLRNADLSGANLKDCNFLGTNLSNAKMVGCNLEGAYFWSPRSMNKQEAILTGVDFYGTDLSQTDIPERFTHD